MKRTLALAALAQTVTPLGFVVQYLISATRGTTAMPIELEERVQQLETTFTQRISTLEQEVFRLSQKANGEQGTENVAWWKKIWGTFKDDPEYDEAMRLGREYRESLRPHEKRES